MSDAESERWLKIAEMILNGSTFANVSVEMYGELLDAWEVTASSLRDSDEWDDWRCLLACLFAAMTPAERREIGLAL